MHRGIGGLLQRQRVVGVGDELAVDAHSHMLAGRFDGDRMLGGGLEDGSVSHGGS